MSFACTRVSRLQSLIDLLSRVSELSAHSAHETIVELTDGAYQRVVEVERDPDQQAVDCSVLRDALQ